MALLLSGERPSAAAVTLNPFRYAVAFVGKVRAANARRQALHNLVELLGWQRQRPGFGDVRLALAPQADFQVRREEADFVALRFHQDVGEDGNRVLALDDSLEKLQFSQKVALADEELHSCA